MKQTVLDCKLTGGLWTGKWFFILSGLSRGTWLWQYLKAVKKIEKKTLLNVS